MKLVERLFPVFVGTYTLVTVLAIFWRPGGPASNGDAAGYLAAARWNPVADRFDNSSHGWGYPATVKLVAFVTRDIILASRIVSAIALAVYLLSSWSLFARLASRPLASASLILLGLLPLVIGLGWVPMADMLFAALAMAALTLATAEAPQWSALVKAGFLAACSVVVRGNGVGLVAGLTLALAVGPSRFRRLTYYTVGLVLGTAAVSSVAASFDPSAPVLRPGAPELAYAALEPKLTSRQRMAWDERCPSYRTLLRDGYPYRLARATVKATLQAHDAWVMRAFGPVGIMVVPGLLLWLRRPTFLKIQVIAYTACLIATYIVSVRFADPRHIIAVLPLLSLWVLGGLALIPRVITVKFGGEAVDLPARMLAGFVLLSPVVVMGCLALADRFRARAESPADASARHLGELLRRHAAGNDLILTGRGDIAYYSDLRFTNYYHLLKARPDSELGPSQVVALAQSRGVRWLVREHSPVGAEGDYPTLAAFTELEVVPGALLFSRDGYFSVWRIE